jgi:hypothetical protein
MADHTAPFRQLDFLYTPSRNVAAELAYFTEVLGGRVVFAVEAMGTRVAAVQLTTGPPLVLLADHVEGERWDDEGGPTKSAEPASSYRTAAHERPRPGRWLPFGPRLAHQDRRKLLRAC